MRGDERRSEGLFSYVRLEERIPADHPLRAVLALVNEVLAALSDRFDEPIPIPAALRSLLSISCGLRCSRRFLRSARSGN